MKINCEKKVRTESEKLKISKKVGKESDISEKTKLEKKVKRK